MQAATAPGRAYGKMFESLGESAGQAIETYSKNKQRGEMLDGQIGTILTNMTPEKQKEIETSPFKPQLDKFLAGEMPLSKKESFFGSLMLDMKMDEQQKQTERQDYLWKKQLQDEKATNEFSRFMFTEGGPTPLDPDPFAPAPDRQYLPSPAERFMQSAGGKEEARRIAESEMSDQAKMQAFQSVMARETAQVPKGTSTVTLMGEDGKPYHWRIDSAGTPIQRIGPAQTQPGVIRSPEEELVIEEGKLNMKANVDLLNVMDKKSRDLIGTGRTARAALNTLNRLPQDATTGGFSQGINTLKKYLNSAGVKFDPEELQNIATYEQFMQQTGEFLFKSIQQTKGSISNAEMKIFMNINPGSVQSRAGNEAMLQFIIANGDRAARRLRYKQDLELQGDIPPGQRVRMLDDWLEQEENSLVHLLGPLQQMQNASNAPPAKPGVGAKQVRPRGGVIKSSSGMTITPLP